MQITNMIAICSVCPDKLRLKPISKYNFECPKCKLSYHLPYEVMAYEDQLESTHQDQTNLETAGLEAGGSGLLSARDDESYSLDEIMEQERNKGKIQVPKYMKDGPVTTVEEFHEEIN